MVFLLCYKQLEIKREKILISRQFKILLGQWWKKLVWSPGFVTDSNSQKNNRLLKKKKKKKKKNLFMYIGTHTIE